jgi:four helix bundle protein
MVAKRLEELVAFQLALEFKRLAYALLERSQEANRDFRFRNQLCDSISSVEANIAEGWRRFAPGEMAQFLRYALGSLEEAKRRIQDGIDRGYFRAADCQEALTFARRCGAATMALWKSRKDSPYRRK